MSEGEKLFWTIFGMVLVVLATGVLSYACGKSIQADAEQCWEIGTDGRDQTRLYRRGEWRSQGSLHVDAADALAFARKAGYVLCATADAKFDGGR